jgi:DNA-binding winged helix-turn-helix (wHTH) protein
MELLVLLVERRGQVVTREEIVEKLWGKEVHRGLASTVEPL